MKITLRTGLKVTAIVLQVVLFVLSGFFLYGAVSSFGATLTGSDGGPFSASMNPDPVTGDMLVTLSGRLKNSGFLSATMSLQVEVMDFDGELVASESVTKSVQPGGVADFTLTMRIPKDVAEELFAPGVQQAYKLGFEYRSIFDWVGIGFSISGGPPQ